MELSSNITRFLLVAALASVPVMGQVFYPEDAQVNLYFPHLADGGGAQRWQTRFTFVNPSPTTTAAASLYTVSDNGSPWNIDLGSGPRSRLNFSVPPGGRLTLTSASGTSASGPQLATGWAYAFSTMPLQATVAFREMAGSTPVLDLTAPATLPSGEYRSAGNRNLGIALANQYSGQSVSISVTAFDQNGNTVGSAQVTLPPLGHQSFNLVQLIPSLPANFLGSVVMAPATQTEETLQFLAWTLNEDSGMLSTLPPGRLEWPISHGDRIWLVFRRVLDAARRWQTTVNFDGAQGLAQGPVQLDAPFQFRDPNQFNADSSTNGHIQIPHSLSELISDSPSEIAWIVAHELGHQVQFRIKGGQPVFANLTSDIETDADIVGMFLTMGAGYDPYAAAGALAKLAMGSGQASPLDQAMLDVSVSFGVQAHPSYGTRINNLWTLLKQICSGSAVSATCQQYKSLVHPDFPAYAPLVRTGSQQPQLRLQPSGK
jgi:hypothetical protein